MANDDATSWSIGDWVEHRANTNVFGIVIGFEGSLAIVRLSSSLAVMRFHEFELQAMDAGDEIEPESDNVIDFTKERALRANSKTEGAA